MTFITLAHYLQLIDRCWRAQDGQKLAAFLSLRHEHVQSVNLHVENPEGMVERFVAAPADEIVSCHLRCLYWLSRGKFVEAYQQQSGLTQCLVKILQVGVWGEVVELSLE